MSALRLTFLGPFQADLAGEPIPGFRTQKALGLLIYLVAERQSHSRDTVMDLFWPDMPPDSARHNLRQVLYYLRQAIPAVPSREDGGETEVPLLLSGRQTIQLNPDAAVQTDIEQFQLLVKRVLQHEHSDLLFCQACRQDLEGAVDLYRGDFLAGFYLPDSGPFEVWAVARRAAFQRHYLDALGKLGSIYLAHEQVAAAEEAVRKQIAVDELREGAQRQLLELLARTGRRNEALAHYDALRQHLWDELGVAPEARTVELVEQIESGTLAAPPGTDQSASAPAPVIRDKQTGTEPLFLQEGAAPEAMPAVFVARERELSQLQEALDAAREGRGQIRFVTGGAGAGKTTLMTEFARRAALDDPELLALTGSCAAITGIADPYLPFREALAMLAGDVEAKWAAGLITTRQARQLWDAMATTVPALMAHGPELINSLLSGQALQERAAQRAPQASAWLRELAELVQRRQSSTIDQKRIFVEYAAVLKAIAKKRPLLLIIEDLHWVDSASSGLLFHLSREIGRSPILLVGTYRPEEIIAGQVAGYAERHPLAGLVSELKRQHGDVWLDLGGLDSLEGRHFVNAYLDTQPNQLSQSFREALFRQTEGHPLFTVELLHAMQERGDLQRDAHGRWVEGQAIDWTNLPLKVEGVIERRIAQLDEVLHSILTTASIEGETFTAEVLAAVLPLDQRQLIQRLSRDLDQRHELVTTHALELLRPGRQRISIYRFRHQLFQHYLYQRLDEVERAYLHEAVGQALEQLYEGHTQEIAGKLAYHFQTAGLLPKAIYYFRVAGEAAAAVYAYNEAADHYSRAVELATSGDVSGEEVAQLYTRLGGLLLITQGDWAPEVGQAYGKAYELLQQGGDLRQRFVALRGLSMYYRMRGELAAGRPYTEELMSLAQRLQDPILVVEASFGLGSLLYFSGEHSLAQSYLDQGISSCQPQQVQPSLDDQDPGAALRSYASHNLWLLGYPDRALAVGRDAIALAEALDHPYSIAMALIWSCWTHIFRGETEMVLDRSQRAVRLSTKHDFPVFEALGTIQHGWALAQGGQTEEGRAKMRHGLADSTSAMGSQSPPATLAIHFAAVYPYFHKPESGLHFLDDALQHAGEGGLRLLEPELLRLQGELLLLRGGPSAAVEALFRQALQLAGRQQARSLELRAAVSLARLWQSQGKTEEARQLLGEILGWFTEGFATLDLQEAGQLLQKLS